MDTSDDKVSTPLEKEYALKPSQHPKTPLFLKMGARSAYFFGYHCIAMDNTVHCVHNNIVPHIATPCCLF